MSIVVFIWVYSLGSHFNNKTSEQANNDLKPFKLFANSISNTYQNITASAGSASTTKEEPKKQIELIPVQAKKQTNKIKKEQNKGTQK
jgi:protein involved in sex pheromone biosynthesis